VNGLQNPNIGWPRLSNVGVTADFAAATLGDFDRLITEPTNNWLSSRLTNGPQFPGRKSKLVKILAIEKTAAARSSGNRDIHYFDAGKMCVW
jgi:hypothetical protein